MKNSITMAGKTWEWGSKTFIMGILNVTPDSFSDGGRFSDIEAALAQATRMKDEGADIIDIGGESTRPGANDIVTADEELRRILPVIQRLSKDIEIPISVDTYKAKTARLAIEAGAHMINDIWGLKKDPEMAEVVASLKVPVCIMHNRETTVYTNLMKDILLDLEQSLEIAARAGVKEEQIILDPGIGFAKTWEQNLLVMKNLEMLKKLGFPILLGASRKSFIGKTLGLEVQDRLEGTLAVTSIGITKKVDIVRVHDVLENVRVARMTDKIVR
ncbi:dihydropteroate synthase [uncultured Sphaerochaeta sp.]|uniref:dihydropteroate synthase n=1 Tax=uncultured Sphaerochaeta sp. TaxID=886478 RepID=UPI002A0A7A0F|nr:dihydropteroate synthase [uncultured Sphaerochaeta sp.]